MAVQETIVLDVQTKGLDAIERRVAAIQKGTNRIAQQQKLNKAAQTEFLIAQKIAEIEGTITREGRKQVRNQNEVNKGKKKELGLTSRIAKAGRSKRLAAATIGGAFPILFGGGPGSSIGGAIGGFAGGGGAAGFAGSLAGSILGGVIDKTTEQAKQLGAALNPLTADMGVLITATGEVNTEFGQMIQRLDELGGAVDALDLATKRLALQIGEDGVQALKDFDKNVVDLGNQLNIAATYVGSLAAGLLNQLVPAITSVLKLFNDANAYVAKRRNDTAFDEAEGAAIEKRTKQLLGAEINKRQAELKASGVEEGFYSRDAVMKEGQAMKRARQLATRERIALLEKQNITKVEQLNKEATIKADALQAAKDAKTTKSPTEKADRQAQQLADLQYNRQLLALKQAYVPLLGEEGRLAEKALREKQIQLQLERDIAKIQAGTSKTKDLEIQNKQLQAAQKLQDLQNTEADFYAKRDESFEKIMQNLELEIKLKEAITDEERKQLEIQKKMAILEGKFTPEQLEKIREALERLNEAGENNKFRQFLADLDKDLNDIQGKMVELTNVVINEFGAAISNAFTGLITGTTSVEEAFSQMFENIGKAFIDMAAKMIAQALVLKALGVVLPGAGGGGGGGGLTGDTIAQIGSYMADGGYVTSPTNAVIGEGGEPEYVIPESRMDSAMARYSEGARGEQILEGPASEQSSPAGDMGTPEIVVQGGVLNFDGSQYIKQDQAPALVMQGAALGEARALKRLRMSPGARRNVGI